MRGETVYFAERSCSHRSSQGALGEAQLTQRWAHTWNACVESSESQDEGSAGYAVVNIADVWHVGLRPVGIPEIPDVWRSSRCCLLPCSLVCAWTLCSGITQDIISKAKWSWTSRAVTKLSFNPLSTAKREQETKWSTRGDAHNTQSRGE